jgi:ABC-type glutathione transport system ATPase component
VSQVNPCGARPSLIDALCKGTFGRSDLLQDPSQASTYASSSDAVGIEASGLNKRYSEKLAVDDLSFQVQPGIVTGFLGPNGAGKSTTMRTDPRSGPPDRRQRHRQRVRLRRLPRTTSFGKLSESDRDQLPHD